MFDLNLRIRRRNQQRHKQGRTGDGAEDEQLAPRRHAGQILGAPPPLGAGRGGCEECHGHQRQRYGIFERTHVSLLDRSPPPRANNAITVPVAVKPGLLQFKPQNRAFSNYRTRPAPRAPPRMISIEINICIVLWYVIAPGDLRLFTAILRDTVSGAPTFTILTEGIPSKEE
jgi:hypothetical protein